MRSEEWRPAAATRNRLPREARRLAVTDPDASPVRQARRPAQNRHGESAGAGVSERRKAPRKAPGVPRHVHAHGCLASTRTTLGAPPPLKFGVAKPKLQTPRAHTRRGN